jgi:membrane fusion protein (multidrug efflux system)
VQGRVNAVLVQEGEKVRAGEPLLQMSSITAAAMQSSAAAQTDNARFQAFSAQIHGESIGTAVAQQNAASRATGLAREAQSSLVISAPADGMILTRNPEVLRDQDIASGQPLLKMADLGSRVVRIFIPASALDRISPGAEVALALPGQFTVLRITLASPGGESEVLPPGLTAQQDYKGIKQAVYYSSRMVLPDSADNPPLGVSGQAKIFGVRRSLAGRGLRLALNLVKAHVW